MPKNVQIQPSNLLFSSLLLYPLHYDAPFSPPSGGATSGANPSVAPASVPANREAATLPLLLTDAAATDAAYQQRCRSIMEL